MSTLRVLMCASILIAATAFAAFCRRAGLALIIPTKIIPPQDTHRDGERMAVGLTAFGFEWFIAAIWLNLP